MRRSPLLFLLTLLAAFALPPVARAAPAGNIDYTDPATWLCLPGRSDACSQEITTTVFEPKGPSTKRTYKVDPDAPVDCFYAYPTVSREPTPNSDMTIGPEEQRVALTQFARFGARCKLYAPMYRQITVAGLREMIRGGNNGRVDFEQPYQDVLAAWNTYLARYNNGRGVVLIGHSQGSNILIRLIASQIDGTPEQKQLVAAIILGARVEIPAKRDVGGSFQHIPLCRTAKQTGCVIAYSSYLAAPIPSATAVFGGAKAGNVDACVDPAALDGTRTLDAELPPLGPATRSLGTTMIETPGQMTAVCRMSNDHTYLAITPSPKADILANTLLDVQDSIPGWGLHVLDINLTLGNLVDLVGTESKAWLASPH